MNYIKLIKSNAIKNYLYDIKFNVNSKIAIYIVYKSENISIPIKHFIYNEIMENMNDDYNLYNGLTKFMDYEKSKYNDFIFGVGKYNYRYRDGENLDKQSFDNYISLYNFILSNINKFICTEIVLTKTCDDKEQIAIMNKNLEIFEMNFLSNWDKIYNEIEKQFIEKIQVEIPMPFKVGDLVYNPDRIEDEPFRYNGLKYNTSFDSYTAYKIFGADISDNVCDDLAEPEYLKLEYYNKKK